jgi:hypothetical protein
MIRKIYKENLRFCSNFSDSELRAKFYQVKLFIFI